ncbi:hypothetical protein BH23VER1_BH23VER1_03560 [soil metagenome]
MIVKLLLPALALSVVTLQPASAEPVSFAREIRPLVKRHCESCHKPDKRKGELDVTTHAALVQGGETGAGVVARDPAASLVLESVMGPDPDMPQKGDALGEEAVALLRRWIEEGAADDSAAVAEEEAAPGDAPPPVYHALPAVTALAFTPDGGQLVVGGHGELVFHDPAGGGPVARVPSGLPRIGALRFTGDGARLVAGGGVPTDFGGFETWVQDSNGSWISGGIHRIAPDELFGLGISPDGSRLVFGGADRIVRVAAIDSGEVVAEFRDHSDWSMGAIFDDAGSLVVTASRDETMRLIDAGSGAMVDSVNHPREPVLCLARHPSEPWCLAGTERGGLFAYTIPEGVIEKPDDNRDPNFRDEFPRLSGPVYALAFSPDGSLVAASGADDEVRVYKTADRSRAATIRVEDGADIYALAFAPDGGRLAFAGYSGEVTVAATDSGEITATFGAAPVE